MHPSSKARGSPPASRAQDHLSRAHDGNEGGHTGDERTVRFGSAPRSLGAKTPPAANSIRDRDLQLVARHARFPDVDVQVPGDLRWPFLERLLDVCGRVAVEIPIPKGEGSRE